MKFYENKYKKLRGLLNVKVFKSIKHYINLYIVYKNIYRICIVFFPLIIVYGSVYTIYGIRYTTFSYIVYTTLVWTTLLYTQDAAINAQRRGAQAAAPSTKCTGRSAQAAAPLT